MIKTHILRKHVHKRLIYQLIMFAIVTLIMIGIVGYDIVQGTVGFPLALIGVIVGLVIGFAVGRMFGIMWHEDTQKVIMKIDRTSILIIVLYIAFRLLSEKFLGHYLHGNELTALTFSILAGIIVGRMFSMFRSINKILVEKNLH